MMFDRLTDPDQHMTLVWTQLAFALLTVLGLSLLSAPYGRHNRAGWGPTIPTRWAWVLMEAPSFFMFLVVFVGTMPEPAAYPLLLLGLWLTHYGHRTFVFPWRIRVRPGDAMPAVIVLLAMVFNTLNSTINATAASGGLVSTWFGMHASTTWLDPRVWIGVTLFVVGTVTHRRADARLAALRAPGESGYKIPHGGLHEYVSCPNYFGELIVWTGWTIATWSPAGLAFLLYTAANLVPRALQHHAWYRATFPDYPNTRRAVLPFLL